MTAAALRAQLRRGAGARSFPAALAAGLMLIWTLVADWPGGIIAEDLSQSRANTSLPAPGLTSQIHQTFVARHDGLRELELILVRPEGAGSDGRITFQLFDPVGATIAVESLDNGSARHNQRYTLRFPAQPNSAGRQYSLLVSGTVNNALSVWGYDLDVYGDGALRLSGDRTAAQDLRFITRYELQPSEMADVLVESLAKYGDLMLLALAFLLMPGCLLLLASRRFIARWDPAAWWGMALSTGVAAWSLLWLWLSVAGGRWRAWSLWALLAVGWLLVIGYWLAPRVLPALARRRASESWQPPPVPSKRQSPNVHWQHGLLVVLLFVGLAVRLLAVRDLAFPPWVDSTRHALITGLMAESGQTLRGYEPLLPVDRFPYHFGFHATAASLLQMTGRPLPQLLLLLGQLLNSLAPLAGYTAAWLFTRRRSTALLVSFLIALPFFFPAYYATWGRMTQLAGMLVLPAAIGLTWRLVRGARSWQRHWWLLALLAAGLLLTHFRVFLLFLAFSGLIWSLSRGRGARPMAIAALAGLLLAAPHIAQLRSDAGSSGIFYAIPGYNAFPVGYITTGWERIFLGLAVASFLAATVAGLARKRWALPPLFLGGWTGLVALLISGGRLGLPETWLLNLNSAYISFFLPLALLLAVGISRFLRWLSGRRPPLCFAGHALFGGALAAAALFGARQQISILNPETILALPQDEAALAWLAEHAPDSSLVAVGSWRWLGRTWAVQDGGAWILPLTGLQTTTPPADYRYSSALVEEVERFNEGASAVESWSDPAAVDWLREQGVTHIFVGARNGFFDPAELARNPAVETLFAGDGVYIFGPLQE